uniref:Uncharacterized protein n=1 Tax=Trypanosoma vivax (strain Y486) TaxID=1055687 RepID=G0TUP9_TRYVY|nr:conserved hypothetical protein [Trypanosoma vivax Y486]
MAVYSRYAALIHSLCQPAAQDPRRFGRCAFTNRNRLSLPSKSWDAAANASSYCGRRLPQRLASNTRGNAVIYPAGTSIKPANTNQCAGMRFSRTRTWGTKQFELKAKKTVCECADSTHHCSRYYKFPWRCAVSRERYVFLRHPTTGTDEVRAAVATPLELWLHGLLHLPADDREVRL